MIRVQQMKLFPVVWLPFVLVVAIAKGICRGSLDVGTADSGLRNNSVRAIVQTRDGYLWVGIHEGQARFDGVRFTVINRANTPANASNRVLGLYEDCEGRLFGYCSSYKEQRQTKVVYFRHACPRFGRQTFHEFTRFSIFFSQWAPATTLITTNKGKKFHAIIRALAFKWIRILLRCWQNRTPMTKGSKPERWG